MSDVDSFHSCNNEEDNKSKDTQIEKVESTECCTKSEDMMDSNQEHTHTDEDLSKMTESVSKSQLSQMHDAQETQAQTVVEDSLEQKRQKLLKKLDQIQSKKDKKEKKTHDEKFKI